MSLMDARESTVQLAATFGFTLNGQPVVVENLSPNVTLLDWLRASGRPGTKQGCAEGDCGACTVAFIERNADGAPTYRSVNSCLVLMPMVAGREIITVEGLAKTKEQRGGSTEETELHPVQKCMVNCHGSQCGYCTPGFVMSAFEGYYRDDLRERWQIDDQLAGNLCRCTGYRPIRDAAARAFAKRGARADDSFRDRLAAAQPELSHLDYSVAGERFLRPASLAALFDAMARYPRARLVAGATELSLLVTKKFQHFEALISLEAVPELNAIEVTDHEYRFGATTTLTRVEEILMRDFDSTHSAFGVLNSAFLNMLWLFGSRQIRNRATIGGNLANASPIGDLAPVLLALDAHVVLASAVGERVLPMGDFFLAYKKTALRADEVLHTIVIDKLAPVPGGGRRLLESFKVSRRREMDISAVCATMLVELDAARRVTKARLAYGGVAEISKRAAQTEAALVGRPWSLKAIRLLRPLLESEFTPINDVRGSAAYRLGIIGDLLEQFFAHDGRQALALDHSPITEPDPWPHRETWPHPHESAIGHVTGRARFVDDQAPRKGMLETWPVCSPHAHANILGRNATVARGCPGIHAVLFAEDIPGANDVGAVQHDEILLADREVHYHGHLVALVVGETQEQCRAAAALVEVEYEVLPGPLSVEDAIAQNSFHSEFHRIRRGDAAGTFETRNAKPEESSEFSKPENANPKSVSEPDVGPATGDRRPSTLRLSGEFQMGGQEHFYLETQSAWAEPGEEPGEMLVHSSTQYPTEIQTVVAHVLGCDRNRVIAQSPRMGGAFGGKETQGNTFAALAALAAHHTRRAVRVWLNRDQDMMLTGKRHPFLARFEVAFTPDGFLEALRAELFSNGGWSLDLSTAICDRALFHLDNAYYIPHVDVRGRVCRTNLASNTAFRGFGGPQGMLVIEEIIDRVARTLGLPPEIVRERNLYRGTGETNTTHFAQEIGDNRIQRIWHELKSSSEFDRRRGALHHWNAQSPNVKRGMAITPVKFGISFTVRHLNQAGALVLIYQDGSIQVNHGGTEMGQGLHTKIFSVVERELGVARSTLRVMPTRTDKVPNTSPTAASSGSDLNGAAVADACRKLKERLLPVAAGKLRIADCRLRIEDPARDIVFKNGRVFHHEFPGVDLSFVDVVQAAYLACVPLSATGFYATPGVGYNWDNGTGTPFHYFACGAAVSEVEVDGLTGAMRVRRVDILHDAGDSLNAGVDRGQIEGGFVQGMGWLTVEELKWDALGQLLTHSPDTYKIPAIGDAPADFRVTLLSEACQRGTIHGSKAVGEPPLMLAISVREAARDAVAAFSGEGPVELASPATAEAIWTAIRRRR